MTQFLSSLIVSIIVAVLTVQLSLRRFYREKWWERRLDAYTRIIEAMHHMRQDLELSHEREDEFAQESEYAKKLSALAQAGWAEIRKATDMGELLLSPEALALLRYLLEERLPPDAMYFEVIEANLSDVRECLPKFIALAKQDLRLSPGKWTQVWSRFT